MQAAVAQVVRDVKWMIEAFRTTAIHSRRAIAGSDTFYGPRETLETTIGTIYLEFNELPPNSVSGDSMTNIGTDAIANVLPGSGVTEQDFLTVHGRKYRVIEVQTHNYFGEITHYGLKLALERRNA